MVNRVYNVSILYNIEYMKGGYYLYRPLGQYSFNLQYQELEQELELEFNLYNVNGRSQCIIRVINKI